VVVVSLVVVTAAAAESEDAAEGFWRIFALTFEFDAAIMLELLSGPVEMFIPPPLLDSFAAVAVDPPDPGAEIVMFKNGLRNCQKIASVSFGCNQKQQQNTVNTVFWVIKIVKRLRYEHTKKLNFFSARTFNYCSNSHLQSKR
jgi:hypothetical protein